MRQTPHENQTIEELGAPAWGFDDYGPFYALQVTEKSYTHHVKVTPRPCYRADVGIIRDELAHLRDVCPLPIPLKICTLPHDGVGGSNAMYYDQQEYVEDGPSLHRGLIVIYGKAIPIFPAFVRYLVAHEYGHAVQYELNRRIGYKRENEIRQAYLDQFRPDAGQHYGPTKWHTNVGELIANDFRILVAQTEVAFWPHDGYARPETLPKLVTFWENVRQMFVGE